MNIPPDDPNAGGLDPSLALTKKGSKVPLIVVGVVVVGVIGFFVMSTMKKQDERKRHAQLMEQFQAIEKDDLGKFWSCILGANVDPSMFQDNLALSATITGKFGTDPKNYPTKVREECTAKAIDAKHKVDDLQAPSEYADALKKYGDSLKAMASAFDAWTKVAPAQVQEMEMGKKVDSAGAAWHAFESGKPDNQVIAWDNFLRCAVPTVDTMKDGQALVEYLFKQCKDPAYVTNLNDKCGPELLQDPPKAPAKSMMGTLKKLAGDDRDLSAFSDCMRKGRKGKRRDDLAEVGKAWVDWSGARRDVLKIGKEALKE
jgi:hypothetical protein